MILDSGICSIFSATDGAAKGNMPRPLLSLKYQSWYGVLEFETAPAQPTDARIESATAMRIRVLQERSITSRDVVLFGAEIADPNDPKLERYEITRAYHGVDSDNNQPITDLTLRRVYV